MLYLFIFIGYLSGSISGSLLLGKFKNIDIRNLNLYSKSYINHLINSNEILASMLLTMNNIVFYQDLMTKIRESIRDNKFDDFYNRYIKVI